MAGAEATRVQEILEEKARGERPEPLIWDSEARQLRPVGRSSGRGLQVNDKDMEYWASRP